MASKKRIQVKELEVKENVGIRVDKQSLPSCSTIFVDQMLGMQLGPFTSKLTLGVQSQDTEGEEVIVPTSVLIMPTNQCLAMAKALMEVFSQGEIVSRLTELQGSFQKEMSELAKEAAGL
ncbi:hypothetical protein IM816_05930 [Luteibacter flocculans]|uniref:Uncharacterized protein n=1 Tax=Luteibacter flocculans TaxID=2780091 RepID=A0ABY4T604_9GAMM|nr:hypothetical protein [Luteibacter flocculans]URL59635.1 hypothetical protein IM816_05930 [Luteibacter flocculans]